MKGIIPDYCGICNKLPLFLLPFPGEIVYTIGMGTFLDVGIDIPRLLLEVSSSFTLGVFMVRFLHGGTGARTSFFS
jgi:hypothetical protein